MYNFALNHDHKFGPIIVIKNVQVSKQKGTCKFFLNGLNGTIFMKYTRAHKKIENIWCTFDKEK
jgi:hypothetical protein